jgi:hypothetical protein
MVYPIVQNIVLLIFDKFDLILFILLGTDWCKLCVCTMIISDGSIFYGQTTNYILFQPSLLCVNATEI